MIHSSKYKPFIRLRCGANDHFHADTKPHPAGGGPEWTWDSKMHNKITLQRAPKDDNRLFVEAYDHHNLKEQFMGGTPHDTAKGRPEEY